MINKEFIFSFTYFVLSENVAIDLMTKWKNLPSCMSVEWYEDDDEYCVDVIAKLELDCKPNQRNKKFLDKALKSYMGEQGFKKYIWDYHYIINDSGEKIL